MGCFEGRFHSLKLRPYPATVDDILSGSRTSIILRTLKILFSFPAIHTHGNFLLLPTLSNLGLRGHMYHHMLDITHISTLQAGFYTLQQIGIGPQHLARSKVSLLDQSNDTCNSLLVLLRRFSTCRINLLAALMGYKTKVNLPLQI